MIKRPNPPHTSPSQQKANEGEKMYRAVSVKERNPTYATIHFVLLDGRIPMMAQYNPQGWCYLSGIPATKAPQVIGGKGVSHWLEPIEELPLSAMPAKNKIDLAEIERQIDTILDSETTESLTTWLLNKRKSSPLPAKDLPSDKEIKIQEEIYVSKWLTSKLERALSFFEGAKWMRDKISLLRSREGNEAVEFAEWASVDYLLLADGTWMQKGYSGNPTKTTQELYQIFKTNNT